MQPSNTPSPIGRPLRVLFLNTSLPVGGAETLLLHLVRNLDPARVTPLIGCLKAPGPIGEILKQDGVPVFTNLIRNKWDMTVLPRLTKLMKREAVDGVVTVGAGDKMFWGRLAARNANVPVILSAIHSTGWPDVIGRLNRSLTGITDAFIAVAKPHGEYLRDDEGFPPEKICVIPNGIDTDRFQFSPQERERVRDEVGIPTDAPCLGIVAALRPEKRHQRFLDMAEELLKTQPDCHFLIVGEGPEREGIEERLGKVAWGKQVHLLGNRQDIPACLSAMDGFVLTSLMEASPVSILEAMSCQRPVVAPRVGSIPEVVLPNVSGHLVDRDDFAGLVRACKELLARPQQAAAIGQTGRRIAIDCGSIRTMILGYQELIETIFLAKQRDEDWNPEETMRHFPSPLARAAEDRMPTPPGLEPTPELLEEIT